MDGILGELPEYLKKEFSKDEINELYEQFKAVDTSGDGQMDASELQVIMTSLGISVDIEHLTSLINEVDANNSGALEFPEFVQLVSNLRKGKNGGLLARFVQNSNQASIIRQEFNELQRNPPVEGCCADYDGLIRRWTIVLPGPKDTPYESGRFVLSAEFGTEYPYEAPKMRFITRIYHLNFVTLWNGSASLNCILTDWTPAWKIRDVLLRVFELMKAPNVEIMDETYNSSFVEFSDSRTVRVAGEETICTFINHRSQYDTIARKFTEMYAD